MNLLTAIITGSITAYILFKFLFGNLSEFYECIQYWAQPDFWSFLKGELREDWLAEFRLFIWAGGSLFVAYCTYKYLQ